MSHLSDKLTPSNFRGYGRQFGEKGGLIDDENKLKEFVAFCPPDVRQNSRVIAVCGIPDIETHSSPAEDGWFHSDFYLFFHLLQDVRM
jgi:hypothetical protein